LLAVMSGYRSGGCAKDKHILMRGVNQTAGRVDQSTSHASHTLQIRP
jgi:hypothetical protein